MKIYETSRSLEGDAGRALDFAAATLAAMGFTIEARRPTELDANGPGLRCAGRSPLRGISAIHLRASAGTLSATADLSSCRRMFLVLGMMLVGMAVFLLVLFNTIPIHRRGPYYWWMPAAPLAPWPVLLPAMYAWANRSARKAVDTLIQNAATMATG